MRLNRLDIRQLPGIDQPYSVQLSGTGVHVIYGPNAIGKSSICRAVEALYWEDCGPSERTSLTGVFEIDGVTWRAEREGPHARWRCSGEDRGPPTIPASHNHRCFFLRLRDLIDPSLEGTHDIAFEIRRQLSGGFDLEQVVKALSHGVGKRHGNRERTAFRSAERAVQEAVGQQSGLQRRADRLDALRAELEAAETSGRRLPAIERAIGLAERVGQHAAVEEDLAALPAALAAISGNEDDEIARLQKNIDEYDERIRKFADELREAGDDKSRTRLTSELRETELAVWRENADDLGRLELQLQTAKDDYRASRKEYEAALSAVGTSDAAATLDLGDHSRLFEFLRAAEEHRAQKRAIEWRLRILENIEQPDGVESTQDNLREAASALRFWLRAPEPERPADRIRSRRSWILFAAALGIAGAALAVFVDPWFALLLAAGMGVLVPVLLLRDAKASEPTRTSAEEKFSDHGVDAPDAWDVRAVEMRLRGLEGEVATIESRLQRARDRDVDRQNLTSDLEGLTAAGAALDERRKELREGLGLDPSVPDAELVDLARALDQLRLARIKCEGAKGRVEELEERSGKLLSDLADVLEPYGEPEPKNAAEAKASVGSLADRNTHLAGALAKERQLSRRLEETSKDRQDCREFVKAIYEKAALEEGDLAGLAVLLQQLPQFRELKDTSLRLESQISLDREALERAGEVRLAECARPELEELQRNLAKSAEAASDLQAQIAEVTAEVDAARREHGLQDLIAQRDRVRAELQERRNEALFSSAGAFLVNTVEKEYEQSQMPRVFDRARSHFSDFTRNGYELRLSRDSKAPRLTAIDLKVDEDRELDELSDGTRAQLLLAARLAFAEEVEQGQTLPLFLDEALDHSDPERFVAIAQSLGRIAHDQSRQIILLTSDPLDVDRLRHALAAGDCEIGDAIDLGNIRTGAEASSSDSLELPPSQIVPDPAGKSAEEYGAALRVPRFTPALGVSQQHLFYVLPDDLETLHGFLGNGIERAGQWKTVAGSPLAGRLCSGKTTDEEVSLRVELLTTFCELWRVGRGRSVGLDALAQSGALSAAVSERRCCHGFRTGRRCRAASRRTSGKRDPTQGLQEEQLRLLLRSISAKPATWTVSLPIRRVSCVHSPWRAPQWADCQMVSRSAFLGRWWSWAEENVRKGITAASATRPASRTARAIPGNDGTPASRLRKHVHSLVRYSFSSNSCTPSQDSSVTEMRSQVAIACAVASHSTMSPRCQSDPARVSKTIRLSVSPPTEGL